MDLASHCSSDLSVALSNDSFAITRRGRQDMLMESRIAPTPFEPKIMHMPPPERSLGCFPDHLQHNPVRRVSEVSNCTGRRVAFGGSKVINEGKQECITDDEVNVRWWTQDDLEEIKEAAKEMSIQLRRSAKEKSCYVGTAYKKTTLMLANNFKELVKLSPSSPDQDLRHWCARNDGRRGLERFASKEYCNCRKDDVIDTRNTVFQEQKRQRTEHVFNVETIAKVSKEKTRRSRTFALFMGEADALTARSSGRSPAKRSKVSHETPKRSRSKLSHSFDSPQARPSMAVESPVVCSSA